MISVIIPVYNAGPYLARCLDSVLNSTYHNFELILINDGSTDNSPAICTEYAQRDSRIKLISQENQGVSAARNRGLEECSGEWIVFVDADDMIYSDFLSLIALDDNSVQDLLLFDFTNQSSASPPGGEAADAHLPPRMTFNSEQLTELLRCILVPRQLVEGQQLNLLSPCAKAYKKSIIDQFDIRFDTKIFHGEDRLFNLEYLLHIKCCAYFCQPVYFYNTRPDSASHRFSSGLLRNHARLLEQMETVLQRGNMLSALEQEYYSYALDNLTSVLIWEIFSPHNSQTYREKCASCRAIWDTALYRQALPYNRVCGRLSRRILVFCFRLKWYHAVSAICVLSNRYLEWKMLC